MPDQRKMSLNMAGQHEEGMELMQDLWEKHIASQDPNVIGGKRC